VPRTRAFILGAYQPNGGSYMTYQIGCILERDFGLEAIAVMDARVDTRIEIYEYDWPMPTVSYRQLEHMITQNDVLILSPFFSDRFYGWRLPGLKVCYVQGFITFSLLDLRCQYYVAVSDFVASFLRTVYGIEASVIPPFINTNALPTPRDWIDRPCDAVQPYVKYFPELNELSLSRLRRELTRLAPEIIVLEPINGMMRVRQTDLLSRIGAFRYLLTLAPAEGFGLVPLEAMAMGTLVTGYDGFGGRQYMRPGENCATVAFPNIERVAELLTESVRDPNRAKAMAESGSEMAATFSYKRFRQSWVAEFTKILKKLRL
jgi:hypothetical protein